MHLILHVLETWKKDFTVLKFKKKLYKKNQSANSNHEYPLPQLFKKLRAIWQPLSFRNEKKNQKKLKDFRVQVKTPGSKKNQIIFSSR